MDRKSCRRVANRTPKCDNCRAKRTGQSWLSSFAEKVGHGMLVLDAAEEKSTGSWIFRTRVLRAQIKAWGFCWNEGNLWHWRFCHPAGPKINNVTQWDDHWRNTLARRNKRLACQVQSLQMKKQAHSLKKGKQLTMESFFYSSSRCQRGEGIDNTIIGEIEAQVGCNNNCDTTVRRHLAEMLDRIASPRLPAEWIQAGKANSCHHW